MSYLDEMPGALPVLQIIHVSDLHIAVGQRAAAVRVRALERWLGRVGNNELWRTLRDGTAPNDPFAPIALRRFIRQITAKDPVWSRLPTWVIDTGDHTVFGDLPSIRLARAELASIVSACGSRSQSLTNLHGNHDAWPGDLPLFGRNRIAAHSSALADQPLGYAVSTSQAPLCTALPSGNGNEVQLYTVDTVDDGAWANSLARGFVDDFQFDQLDEHLKLGQGRGAGRHLRILATHHPVHFPTDRPVYTMRLANAEALATRINVPPRAIQLVLSGHTHALFPAHGALPYSPRVGSHAPLGADQCQLVIGTLMQVDRFGKRGDNPQQCQVLRFHQDPGNPDLVVMERLLVGRNPSASPPRLEFAFVPVPGSGELAEEMLLVV